MSECFVEGRNRDTAVLLLAAAENLGLPASVVQTTSRGYLVPEEVAKAADELPVEAALSQIVADQTAQAEGETPPAESALKGEWVDYAVSRGVPRDEAEAMTKAQLIEQYGNKE